MKIAVILPSRGLIFSQTADELLQNLQELDYEIFFSHGRPIPECFEKPVTEALRGSFTHLWLVEDDMILPPTILHDMLDMDVPVVACDYPVSPEGQGALFKDKEGRVVFSGTGCLLVKRAVFDKLSKPYFRSDIRWNAVNHGGFIRFTANRITNPDIGGYGLHDVNFGIKLWEASIPISEARSIGQRKLIKLGETGTNDGAHQIETWTKLKPDYLLKRYLKTKPQPMGKLVEVQTLDGPLLVHPDKAKKMYKAGVAQKVKQQSVVFDFNEINI